MHTAHTILEEQDCHLTGKEFRATQTPSRTALQAEAGRDFQTHNLEATACFFKSIVQCAPLTPKSSTAPLHSCGIRTSLSSSVRLSSSSSCCLFFLRDSSYTKMRKQVSARAGRLLRLSSTCGTELRPKSQEHFKIPENCCQFCFIPTHAQVPLPLLYFRREAGNICIPMGGTPLPAQLQENSRHMAIPAGLCFCEASSCLQHFSTFLLPHSSAAWKGKADRSNAICSPWHRSGLGDLVSKSIRQ